MLCFACAAPEPNLSIFSCALTTRYLVEQKPSENQHNNQIQPLPAADEEGQDEEGNKNSDIAGQPSGIHGGARRRSSGNGSGGGHQKRHQEWLDRLGEVTIASNCHCFLRRLC